MKKYIPYPAFPEDVPIDLSYLYESERPAGKHGFLQATDDHFTFEDGTPGRFWGVNINGSANFPEHSYSEIFAKRLMKVGINLVRFHQLDAEWATPNIFQFTKGCRKGNTRSFDEQSMERLDYLVYCLKEAGIYIYMDIHTYRKFKAGDGIQSYEQLADAAKPYTCFDEGMIELQKAFATDFWLHYNPYTKLQNKDDPVFVLGEVTNENDLFQLPITVEPYASDFRRMFKDWGKHKEIQVDSASIDINGDDPDLVNFKIELQEKYYKEIIAHLRGLGVRIPLCGTNWYVNDANLKAQLVGDYTDSHMYFYDWRWGEFEKHCINQPLSGTFNINVSSLGNARTIGKPFFCSEWDMPWPNEYRAESSILYAAISAYQNWGGMAIHTYSYTTKLERMQILGKEINSSSIGNVPYREGIFSVWNDPAKFGLFYHSAMIVRRADITPGKTVTAVQSGSLAEKAFNKGKPVYTGVEARRLGIKFDEEYDGTVIADTDLLVPESAGEIASDNGQLYRSWKKKYGTIKTPMTKCAYGLLNQNQDIDLDGVKVNCHSDFAVIAMSSISDQPIVESDNILLTTVGRVENTDAKFADELMLDYGRAPIRAEAIEADIEIKTKQKALRVWAISPEGLYVGKVPATYEDGKLKFSLGKTMCSVYYLIQAD